MRFRPKIDEHDINFKTNRLREFLLEGHKVRAYVEFRGREMTHTEFGQKILNRIREQLDDVGQPEPGIRMEGRHMSMIINPKKGMAKPKSQNPKPKAMLKRRSRRRVSRWRLNRPTPQAEAVPQAAVNQNVTVDSSSDGLSV